MNANNRYIPSWQTLVVRYMVPRQAKRKPQTSQEAPKNKLNWKRRGYGDLTQVVVSIESNII